MAPRKPTNGKSSRSASNASAQRASARRFATVFYRKHGAVMSKLSRA